MRLRHAPIFARATRSADAAAGALERLGVVLEHEDRRRHLQHRIDLERELRRILGRVELAHLLRAAHLPLDVREPPLAGLAQLLAHRAGMRVELRLRRGEEAAAGEDLALEVREERVRERLEPRRSLGRPRRLDHLARRRSRSRRRSSRAGAPPSSRSGRRGRSSTCRCARRAGRSRGRRGLRPWRVASPRRGSPRGCARRRSAVVSSEVSEGVVSSSPKFALTR